MKIRFRAEFFNKTNVGLNPLVLTDEWLVRYRKRFVNLDRIKGIIYLRLAAAADGRYWLGQDSLLLGGWASPLGWRVTVHTCRATSARRPMVHREPDRRLRSRRATTPLATSLMMSQYSPMLTAW